MSVSRVDLVENAYARLQQLMDRIPKSYSSQLGIIIEHADELLHNMDHTESRRHKEGARLDQLAMEWRSQQLAKKKQMAVRKGQNQTTRRRTGTGRTLGERYRIRTRSPPPIGDSRGGATTEQPGEETDDWGE